MLPNRQRGSLVRLTLVAVALAAAIVFVLVSLGRQPQVRQAAARRFDTAAAQRESAATRAAVVIARAAEARAAVRPVLARAEVLRSRVRVEGVGQLRVQNTGREEPTLVPVPPLVTERIQADSAALGALSLAVTWDGRALAAQQEQLVADEKVSDAARITIAQLERERRPRCGWRCGMVLGAASIVALGIAVDQTRRLVYH